MRAAAYEHIVCDGHGPSGEKVSRFVIKFVTEELAKHATFINRTNTTLRNGEMTCQAKFDQVVTFHRLILVALFQLMDEDGGGVLDMMEIRILARAMGVKLTDGELKDAMAEMVRRQPTTRPLG